MAALLKERLTTGDNVSVSLTPGLRTAYMVRTEFEGDLQRMTCKVFASESAAKTYAAGQEVIKVEVVRKFD